MRCAQPSKDSRNALASRFRLPRLPTPDYVLDLSPHRVLDLQITSPQALPAVPLATARSRHLAQTFNDGTNYQPPHSPRSRDRQPRALIRVSLDQSARITQLSLLLHPDPIYPPVGHKLNSHAISPGHIPHLASISNNVV